MNYQELFDTFLNSLRTQPAVTLAIDEFYLKTEISPALFEQNPYLSPIREELYVLNDNLIQWHFATDNMPAGEFHFYAIEQVLALPPVGDGLLVFEDHPEAGDGLMGCIKFTEGNHEMWLHDAQAQSHKLSLDMAGYLKNLVRFKGIFGWQYLFAGLDMNAAEQTASKASLKTRLTRLTELFPKEDYEMYLGQLK